MSQAVIKLLLIIKPLCMGGETWNPTTEQELAAERLGEVLVSDGSYELDISEMCELAVRVDQ